MIHFVNCVVAIISSNYSAIQIVSFCTIAPLPTLNSLVEACYIRHHYNIVPFEEFSDLTFWLDRIMLSSLECTFFTFTRSL